MNSDGAAGVECVLPHDYEAEQALLGALLVPSSSRIADMAEFLRSEHFADPAHASIYAAILAADERGERPNPLTLQAYFRSDEYLEQIGGVGYLSRLCASVPSLANARDFAGVVRDLADRRAIIGTCKRAMAEAFAPKPDMPAKAIVDFLEGELTELAADADQGGRPEPVLDIGPRVMASIEAMYKGGREVLGISTGYRRLDNLLGGLQPGQLVIVGGRPSMGKSVLGENIGRYVAASPICADDPPGAVGLFSLEMTKEEMFQRSLAAEADVPFHAIRKGRLEPCQFEKLALSASKLGRHPLFVDDTPGLGVGAMRARARRLKRRHGLRLLVVDHLHLVGGGSGQNRNDQLADITKGLKRLAKELEVPVIVLAQLSRALESREDKRPQLSDLRESGAIEQDADVVMFVYREQYYLERSEPFRRPEENEEKFNARYTAWQSRCAAVWGMGEVIIAKQRNGPVGTVRLGFSGQYCRFTNMDDDGGMDD